MEAVGNRKYSANDRLNRTAPIGFAPGRAQSHVSNPPATRVSANDRLHRCAPPDLPRGNQGSEARRSWFQPSVRNAPPASPPQFSSPFRVDRRSAPRETPKKPSTEDCAVCGRASLYLGCMMCGMVVDKGRKSVPCAGHPGVKFLMDFECCPKCGVGPDFLLEEMP